MKRYKVSVLFFVGLCLLSLYISSAQDASACAAIVQAALQTVDELCSATARNQACYGNLTLEAEPQPDVTNLKFDAPGDIANVTDISTLHLSALDETSQEWGVSVLRLQANLPDTLPGQNVTMLLFGNVEITPDTSADDDAPLQAFYLKTGINDAPCYQAPDSGVLIQTPKGVGEIEFTINEVNIRLGSTAYIQAQPNANLIIRVVEGQARVEAFDVAQTVPEGTKVEVSLDNALAASGPPSDPLPYTQEDVAPLPVGLLPESIMVAEPLSEAEIAAFREKANACEMVSAVNIDLYAGPGTNYRRVGNIKIVRGRSQLQATGIDGLVWYNLGVDIWVRSDVVETRGDCANLPVLSTLPPVPTALPTAVVSEPTTVGLWTCTPSSPFPVKAGTVYLQMGYSNPEWGTCESARAGIQGLPSFVGDGPAPFDYRFFGSCHVNTDHGGYGVDAEATVILEPGTYTYRGVWNDAGGPGSSADTPACTFTVVP